MADSIFTALSLAFSVMRTTPMKEKRVEKKMARAP